MVGAEQVGGVFVGSWTDKTMLTGGGVDRMQSAATVPVMVTIDEEGGRVSRAADLLGSVPSARETAATMTPEQTYEMWLERGRGLKDLGITVDFAPDVDVSSQPDDSVIGDRSYSDDPATVVAYAGAAARGLRDAGVMPVIKHFQGTAPDRATRTPAPSRHRRCPNCRPATWFRSAISCPPEWVPWSDTSTFRA